MGDGARVTGLLKTSDIVSGVRVRELEGDAEIDVRARVVINATGVFTDDVLRMDAPDARPLSSHLGLRGPPRAPCARA